MGTPLPPLPPDPGELCDVCWGDGGALGRITSRVLSVTLYDLEEGSSWREIYRDELFTPTDLIQDLFAPCLFETTTPNFSWRLQYGTFGSFFQVSELFPGTDSAFILNTVDQCVIVAPNLINVPIGFVAFNGTMSIFLGSP